MRQLYGLDRDGRSATTRAGLRRRIVAGES